MGSMTGQPRRGMVIGVAIAVLALVWCSHFALSPAGSHRPHHPHPLLSSLGREFAVNVDHAHLSTGSLSECHNEFPWEVTPQTTITLAALGVAVALIAITTALSGHVTPSGRDPPHVHPTAHSGQDLLTKICLARR